MELHEDGSPILGDDLCAAFLEDLIDDINNIDRFVPLSPPQKKELWATLPGTVKMALKLRSR